MTRHRCAHSCERKCAEPSANRSCSLCGAHCLTDCCKWRLLSRRPGRDAATVSRALVPSAHPARRPGPLCNTGAHLRLCETAAVRVVLVNEMERQLFFYTSTRRWGGATEARVQCRQSGCNCTRSVTPSRSMAECAPCPCDQVPSPNQVPTAPQPPSS